MESSTNWLCSTILASFPLLDRSTFRGKSRGYLHLTPEQLLAVFPTPSLIGRNDRCKWQLVSGHLV